MTVDAVKRIATYGEAGISGWVRDTCPFCFSRTGKEDRRKSFGINIIDGYYICHKCGTKGYIKTEESLLPKQKPKLKEAPPIMELRDYHPLWMEPGLNAEVFSKARAYLRSRGLGRAAWQEAHIGACFEGYFKNRIIVPLTEEPTCAGEHPNGAINNWIGWVARDWTGRAQQKYLYPKGMSRSQIMWEGWRLSEESDKPLMVVEGVFDALPYYGSAIALLGKPTHIQVARMKESKRTLVIVLDSDAWEEGYALAQKLTLNGGRVGFVKLPAGEDPGSIDRSWLIDAVEKTAREKERNG